MSGRRIQSFEEFWPFYVREHSLARTRTMHFIGTSAAMLCVAAGVVGKRRWLVLAPIIGYGPAWISHFFVEKNRPASFTYPVWSFRADLKMWSLMVRGQMNAEVDRVHSEVSSKAPVDDGGTGQVHTANGNAPDRDSMN